MLLDLPQEIIEKIHGYLSDRHGLLRSVTPRWTYLTKQTDGVVACESESLVRYAGEEATAPRAVRNLSVLKRIFDESTQEDNRVARAAAKYGEIDALFWLYGRGIINKDGKVVTWDDPWDVTILHTAAKHGQIETIKWLRTVPGRNADWGRVVTQVDTSSFFRGLRSHYVDDVFDYDTASSLAARHGQLKTLQWMRSFSATDRCPWNIDTSTSAAAGGQLHILQWMQNLPPDDRCPWSTSAATAAARHNRLDILKWMRGLPEGERCPWDKYTPAAAAAGGHINILKWLYDLPRDDRCPCSVEVMVAAAQCNQLEILKWIRKHPNEYRWPQDYNKAIVEAAKNDHIGIIVWICSLPDEERRPWDGDVTEAAVSGGNLNLLNWLYDHDFPLGVHTVRIAAIHGHLHILKWLYKKGRAVNDWVKMIASTYNYEEVLKWVDSLPPNSEGGV
jgi:hypothetical protein